MLPCIKKIAFVCSLISTRSRNLVLSILDKHTHAYYIAIKESGVLPGAYFHDFDRIFHIMIMNDQVSS